jgi:hypothetical protein
MADETICVIGEVILIDITLAMDMRKPSPPWKRMRERRRGHGEERPHRDRRTPKESAQVHAILGREKVDDARHLADGGDERDEKKGGQQICVPAQVEGAATNYIERALHDDRVQSGHY